MKKTIFSILVFFLIVGSLTFAYRAGYKKESQEHPTQCLTVLTENGTVAIPQDEVVSFQIGKQLPSEAQQNLKEEPKSVIPEGDYIFKQPFEVIGGFTYSETYAKRGKIIRSEQLIVKKWTTENGLVYGKIVKDYDLEGNLTKEHHAVKTFDELEGMIRYVNPEYWKSVRMSSNKKSTL